MTDQRIVTGLGEIAEDSGTLGLNVYAYFDGQPRPLFVSADMGQGFGALAWLTGDFFGPGNPQILQPWDANGTLGLNVYTAYSSVTTAFVSSDLGQGSGALAWLTGDFTGSGRTQIMQPWDANGTLGLNVYGASGDGSVQTVFSSADLGQGSGARAWLADDFLGEGRVQIAQLWDNNGSLGLNLYGYVAGNVGALQSQDMGEGSGALAWLTGDFLGLGSTQIAQVWDNNGTVGLIVYGTPLAGLLQQMASFPDTGQGSGALAWLTGDFTGSGRDEIAQLWNNNGTLGLNVYGNADGSGWNVLPFPDLGQGPDAVAWLSGDFTASGHDQIAQLWDNHGTLGLIVYDGVDTDVHTVFNSPDMGQGSGALAWLTGDFFGLGSTQIAQPWRSLG